MILMKKVMNFALDIGEIMLKAGAETYRVEDTINRIMKSHTSHEAESFVTPTGIFATLNIPDGDHITHIRRINQREIHLEKIERANRISREFCEASISLEEATRQLNELDHITPYNPGVMILAIGGATGMFALVLGGSMSDALIAFIDGIILAFFQHAISKKRISKFLIDIIGGALMGLLSVGMTKLIGIGDNLDLIIISAIMPLVPGVAITNAIRDTIHGDLVSGTARILDAFIIAASIATGVGMALTLSNFLVGGGLL